MSGGTSARQLDQAQGVMFDIVLGAVVAPLKEPRPLKGHERPREGTLGRIGSPTTPGVLGDSMSRGERDDTDA